MILLFRILLAFIFAIAGAAKLIDLSSSRDAVRSFGVPERLVRATALILPLVELAVGIALLIEELAWWGAVAAFLLLTIFVIAIAVNLLQGRKPKCNCFGQIHSAPIGRQTLLRNGFLALLSGAIVLQGSNNVGPSVTSYVTSLLNSQLVGIVLTVLILGLLALEAWFIEQLMKQNGRLLLRIQALENALTTGTSQTASLSTEAELPLRGRAPSFAISGLYGEVMTLDALRASNKPLLLMFLDPDCGPCNDMLPKVSEWQRVYSDKLIIALINSGTLEANRTKGAEYGLTQMFLQKDQEIAEAYGVGGTPGAVLIEPDGNLGSDVVMGAPAISTLLAKTIGENSINNARLTTLVAKHRSSANGSQTASTVNRVSKIGHQAPTLKLPDLNGEMIELKAFRGSDVMVLFWNPTCGFCQRMLEDLISLDIDFAKAGQKLLVVSTGDVEANKSMRLQSPVLLETEFTIGREFGAYGTPSAVLIDARGKIASDVAVGASAVLALAGNLQAKQDI